MPSSVPPLLGSTTPRLWTQPLVTGPPGSCGCGCALTPETSKGFSAVEFAEGVIGVPPLPWQRWLLIHALELRADGRFRFRTVLILVARQNGKTTLVEVKNLWKMFVLRVPLVIGTAQNLDISEESWEKAVEIAESIPELKAEIEHVDRTNGKKSLRLVGGPRWKIAAASRKGGRGLSGDDVNLDELREHHTWDAWGAVTKTTMARPNPQVWAFSNAGDDKSVVLIDLQAKARAAAASTRPADTTLGLFEWSAPEDVRCTCGRPGGAHLDRCRLADRAVWAQANPSLGYTISEESLLSALNTDPEPVFRTECLCQHVPTLVEQWRVIPEALWTGQIDTTRPAEMAFAVQVDYRRNHTAIAACGVVDDGTLRTSIVAYQPGTHWVVDRLVELKTKHRPIAIAVQDKGPTGSLIDDMAKVGILPPEHPDHPRRSDLAIPWADDVADAYGLYIDALNQVRLFHADDAPLNRAVADASTRSLSGSLAWDYKGETDCSPLLASTFALWAYVTRAPLVVEEFAPSAHWL